MSKPTERLKLLPLPTLVSPGLLRLTSRTRLWWSDAVSGDGTRSWTLRLTRSEPPPKPIPTFEAYTPRDFLDWLETRREMAPQLPGTSPWAALGVLIEQFRADFDVPEDNEETR